MTWLIAIAVVLGIAALLVFGVLSLIVEIFYAPGREPSTTPQIWLLVALGVAALVVSVVLDSVAPGAMAIPWVLWFWRCRSSGTAPHCARPRDSAGSARPPNANKPSRIANARPPARQWLSANALTR